MKYECPWCRKASFSFWDKQKLGPTRTIACRTCSRHVGVDTLRAQLASTPVLALGFLGLVLGKVVYANLPAVLLGAWIGITFGMFVTAPLYHFFVPLKKPAG
jgi:hypothetical protein